MSKKAGMHEPPAWTKPGARWVAWMAWPMLLLCAGLTVWRIAEGASGRALYPTVSMFVFGGLLILNRANRRRS